MVNVASIAGAAVASHRAPYLTLLLAYAILGPAHYLTEISLLHRRCYFVPRSTSVALCLAALALLFVLGGGTPFGCAALAGAIALSVTGVLGASPLLMAAGTLAVFALGLAFGAAGARPMLLAAILIPTVVHVLAFNIGFVVRGACKTRGVGDTWCLS